MTTEAESLAELGTLVVAVGDPRLPDKFWSRVAVVESGCWLWTGTRTGDGYGQFYHNRSRHLAHRVSRAVLVGDCAVASRSLKLDQVDHLCRTPACVNPGHLDPVTARTNVLRGNSPTAVNARKSVCPRCGGEYTDCERGGRRCVPCAAKQSAAHNVVRKVQHAANQRKVYARNRDAIRARQAVYKGLHRDEINAKARAKRRALKESAE